MSIYGHKVGRFGEKLAQQYLIKKGYTIIAVNYKNSYYEIDIIAKIKKKCIFVEVKTRTSSKYGDPEDSITRKKINNLKQGIMAYARNNMIDLNFIRADLITIDIKKTKKIANIKHYKDIL